MSIAGIMRLQLPELRVCRSSGLRKKAYFGKNNRSRRSPFAKTHPLP